MSDQSGYTPVGTPPATPGLPQNPLPIVYQGFSGLNTKASQQGIEDQEMFISDGFMPLGPNNLRALRGLGDAIYTVPGGEAFAAGNISFSGQPAPGDTYTLNGVTFTFVVSGGGWPTFNSNIGGNLAGTIFLITLNLPLYTTNTHLNVASYVISSGLDALLIFYNTPGPDGNDYTLAVSGSTMTPSAATLVGGGIGIKNFSFNNIGAVPICMICLSDGSLVQVNMDTMVSTLLRQTTASGFLSFSMQPNPGDTVTLNGNLFTFRIGGGDATHFGIGGNLAGTILLMTFNLPPNANNIPTLTVATYAEDPGFTKLNITYATPGAAGNTYTLAATGGIITPSGATLTGGTDGSGIITEFFPDYSQWADQYIIIVAPQDNGYFLWDGASLFLAGTLAPQVTIINSGKNYTVAPTIAVSGGSGSGAQLSASIVNGALTTITVNNPGTGYLLGENVILTISGGSSDDSAAATATVSANSGISAVNVLTGGHSYSALANITHTATTASIPATLVLQGNNGVITGVTVVNPGQGYTTPPTLAVVDQSSSLGAGATLSAVMASGQIASVAVTAPGSNYVTPPTLTIVGDGFGAVLQAHITGGLVDTITVVNGGIDYTQALIQFSGGNDGAAAVATLMPFGVSGDTVEVYQSRVWVGNGRIKQYSAPGNPADFDASHGAGASTATASNLRIGYTQFTESNGFLYTFADSSIQYISGVQTSGNPPLTTFNDLNVDPQVGTPWHGTVQPFGRDLVFANPVGVFVSYGGAVTKVSDALDGIYASVPQDQWPIGFEPSAAVMTIFGIRVYILTYPILDQVSGSQVIKCLMWDGKKWFTSPQEGLTKPFIASQDLNSVLTAYCSANQTSIKPMFTNYSQAFTRYLYSKLWDNPGMFLTKMSREVFGILNINYIDTPSAATGYVLFSGQPAVNDRVTLNGYDFRFTAGSADATHFAIGGNLAGTILLMTFNLPPNTAYSPSLAVASYAEDSGFTKLNITYNTVGSIGNTYTLSVGGATLFVSNGTLTGGHGNPEILVAALTENGVGTETTIDPTVTGPMVFGPFPSANPGKLQGVRIKTEMSDIQINAIALINQIIQSNV